MRILMKKLAIITAIATILFPASVPAQEKTPKRLIFCRNSTELFILFWQRADLLQVDTTRLEVQYDLKYRLEPRTGTAYEMVTVLETGDAKWKYYSLIRQFTDKIQMSVTGHMEGVAPVPGIGHQHTYTDEELHIKDIAGVDLLNSEIWTDLPTRTVKERMHDYLEFDLSIEYEEPQPVFEWQMEDKIDTICGYPCFAAKTTFRGRNWIVWYTPEIPVSAGPWKLNGLPGLILRAQDTHEDYIWQCRSITRKAEPMMYYKVKERLLSREKWRRNLRQIHEDPLTMLGQNGQNALYIQGKRATREDHWQIPYNPIELE